MSDLPALVLALEELHTDVNSNSGKSPAPAPNRPQSAIVRKQSEKEKVRQLRQVFSDEAERVRRAEEQREQREREMERLPPGSSGRDVPFPEAGERVQQRDLEEMRREARDGQGVSQDDFRGPFSPPPMVSNPPVEHGQDNVADSQDPPPRTPTEGLRIAPPRQPPAPLDENTVLRMAHPSSLQTVKDSFTRMGLFLMNMDAPLAPNRNGQRAPIKPFATYRLLRSQGNGVMWKVYQNVTTTVLFINESMKKKYYADGYEAFIDHLRLGSTTPGPVTYQWPAPDSPTEENDYHIRSRLLFEQLEQEAKDQESENQGELNYQSHANVYVFLKVAGVGGKNWGHYVCLGRFKVRPRSDRTPHNASILELRTVRPNPPRLATLPPGLPPGLPTYDAFEVWSATSTLSGGRPMSVEEVMQGLRDRSGVAAASAI